MINNYESICKGLSKRTTKPNMNLRRTRNLSIEIYKNLNNLNPEFSKDLFRPCGTKRVQRGKYKFTGNIWY